MDSNPSSGSNQTNNDKHSRIVTELLRENQKLVHKMEELKGFKSRKCDSSELCSNDTGYVASQNDEQMYFEMETREPCRTSQSKSNHRMSSMGNFPHLKAPQRELKTTPKQRCTHEHMRARESQDSGIKNQKQHQGHWNSRNEISNGSTFANPKCSIHGTRSEKSKFKDMTSSSASNSEVRFPPSWVCNSNNASTAHQNDTMIKREDRNSSCYSLQKIIKRALEYEEEHLTNMEYVHEEQKRTCERMRQEIEMTRKTIFDLEKNL